MDFSPKPPWIIPVFYMGLEHLLRTQARLGPSLLPSLHQQGRQESHKRRRWWDRKRMYLYWYRCFFWNHGIRNQTDVYYIHIWYVITWNFWRSYHQSISSSIVIIHPSHSMRSWIFRVEVQSCLSLRPLNLCGNSGIFLGESEKRWEGSSEVEKILYPGGWEKGTFLEIQSQVRGKADGWYFWKDTENEQKSSSCFWIQPFSRNTNHQPPRKQQKIPNRILRSVWIAKRADGRKWVWWTTQQIWSSWLWDLQDLTRWGLGGAICTEYLWGKQRGSAMTTTDKPNQLTYNLLVYIELSEHSCDFMYCWNLSQYYLNQICQSVMQGRSRNSQSTLFV